jgi:hypothetical protein
MLLLPDLIHEQEANVTSAPFFIIRFPSAGGFKKFL